MHLHRNHVGKDLQARSAALSGRRSFTTVFAVLALMTATAWVPASALASAAGESTAPRTTIRAEFLSGVVVSDDGRFYAFAAVGIRGSDPDGDFAVYRWEPATNGLILVSVTATGDPASGYAPSMSADGNRIAFESDAPDLVAGDHNGTTDVFVRDIGAATTTRVVGPSGVEPNGWSSDPDLTPDGNVVAFSTSATNLVTPDANGAVADIVVADLTTDAVERASVSGRGRQLDAPSRRASVSADGRRVAFLSSASNLTGGTGQRAVVRDLEAGTTRVFPAAGTCSDLPSPRPADVLDAQLSHQGNRLALVHEEAGACASQKAIAVIVRAFHPATVRLGPERTHRWTRATMSGDGRTLGTFHDDRFDEQVLTLTGRYGGTYGDCSVSRASLSATGRYLAYVTCDWDNNKDYLVWRDLGEPSSPHSP